MTVDNIPRRRTTVPHEKYEAVRQELTRLEEGAMLMEATYRQRVATLQGNVNEYQIELKRCQNRISALEEELARWERTDSVTLSRLRDVERKYEHALRVIRDLINERVRKLSFRILPTYTKLPTIPFALSSLPAIYPLSPTHFQQPGNTDIDPALLQDIISEAQRPDANTLERSAISSSRVTARPLPSPALSFYVDSDTSARGTPSNSSLFRRDVGITSPEKDRHSGKEHPGDEQSMDVEQFSVVEGPSVHPVSTVLGGEHAASTTATSTTEIFSYESSPELWVYWDKPPRSARYTLGPEPFETIENTLRLEDNEVAEVDELEVDAKTGLAVAFKEVGNLGHVAFLYHPIYYEVDRRSYLVSWAEPRVHEMNVEYLANWCRNPPGASTRPIIHVLALPDAAESSGQKGWWYFSAMKWKVVELPSIWDVLDEEQRQKLVDHLYRRSDGNTSRAAIGEKLATGRLQQLTVEMKAASAEHTERFARRAGFTSA
ncbi:hypothetical protein D9611_002562 [Ephemerocybe angulata]|uniref:Uncharacterized protein n=1 Tax=Ephemerocybe angulata TaxID=980116 RepID=A0A8H5FEI3_9AGAR|nr:hypothetical protein D9611_002562 [Tulosesus angulatus]